MKVLSQEKDVLPSGVYIGCAGWSIPKEQGEQFSGTGSHLERYAAQFSGVEINSTFYRSHKPETYARWAASTPESFRFAVKAPREITHLRRLVDAKEPLERFLSEVAHLGPKLGPLLIQLPPSLAFDARIAGAFFTQLRQQFSGQAACEPRHQSWFDPESEQIFTEFHVARVAADPALSPEAALPGGWDGMVYYRLHGSPRMYYTEYSEEYLSGLADAIREVSALSRVWCIFDNTASGAATANALLLLKMLWD
jgi:uncharacterized protein YecE (DUF72 family)